MSLKKLSSSHHNILNRSAGYAKILINKSILMEAYMIDRTIPFYNIILRYDTYQPQQINLPSGYTIMPYQAGFEADWARLQCMTGDFSNIKEAVQYFTEKYLDKENDDDILFLLNDKDQVIGSCISWTDERQGCNVNSLHWLVVNELYQGNGHGRMLCREAINRFYLHNQKPIYIHTQPWSWKAVLLYISLGFRLQKTDTFASYSNQYNKAMEILKSILTPKQYYSLVLASDN